MIASRSCALYASSAIRTNRRARGSVTSPSSCTPARSKAAPGACGSTWMPNMPTAGRALHALGCVVEEDDLPGRLPGPAPGEVGVGMGFADAQVGGIDERVEAGELGRPSKNSRSLIETASFDRTPTRRPAAFASRIRATASGTTRLSGTTRVISRYSDRQSSNPARVAIDPSTRSTKSARRAGPARAGRCRDRGRRGRAPSCRSPPRVVEPHPGGSHDDVTEVEEERVVMGHPGVKNRRRTGFDRGGRLVEHEMAGVRKRGHGRRRGGAQPRPERASAEPDGLRLPTRRASGCRRARAIAATRGRRLLPRHDRQRAGLAVAVDREVDVVRIGGEDTGGSSPSCGRGGGRGLPVGCGRSPRPRCPAPANRRARRAPDAEGLLRDRERAAIRPPNENPTMFTPSVRPS